MKRALVLVAVLVLLAAPALAQGEEPAAGESDEKDIITITPKEGGWEIEELFRTIALYTDQSIVYDPTAPAIARKKIEFVGTQTVPREHLFAWFQSLLSFQRLILVPVGPKGYEQWMALDTNSPQITTRPIFVPENEILDWADRDGVYIVSTITVKNMGDTSRARNALSQLATRTTGRINDVPGNQSFVVADFAPEVASMYRVIRAMDVEPVEYTATAKTYRLENAVALELEPILIDLLQEDPSTSGGRRRPQTPGVPDKPAPRIIADTRQDAIIVFAVPEDHLRIEELITLLDQKVHYKRGNIHFRPVEHTNAGELAELLTELIRGGLGTPQGTGRRPTGRRPGQPGAGPVSSGTLTGAQEEPVIVADDRTNSLLIQATATQIEDLDGIIANIDVPRDQVLVEAALIELTVDDLFRFGVELVSATTQNSPDERTFFGLSRPSGLSTLEDTDGDLIPDINIPNAANAGLTAGIFDNARFPVILQALSTSTKARALNMPSVVVEDGSQAVMTVRDQVPFPISEDTDTGITRQRVEFTDAEITLDISPHISSDNYLRLHIHQTVESFRGQTDPSLPPPTTSREIETDIVVPDGYTVVLGGLITESSQESDEGVPWLKDIPLLGWVFGSQRDTASNTSLFLFVTPRILRNPKSDFTEYHRASWERKQLADRLFRETLNIYGSNFKMDPGEGETLETIQESGFLDQPRYKNRSAPKLSEAEKRERFRQITKEREGQR